MRSREACGMEEEVEQIVFRVSLNPKVRPVAFAGLSHTCHNSAMACLGLLLTTGVVRGVFPATVDQPCACHLLLLCTAEGRGATRQVPEMGDSQGLLCQTEGFTPLLCFYRTSSTPHPQCWHT